MKIDDIQEAPADANEPETELKVVRHEKKVKRTLKKEGIEPVVELRRSQRSRQPSSRMIQNVQYSH